MTPGIERLERAALIAWPARERETLFGWELQSTDGQSGRVNSAWTIAWTGEAPLETAIERTQAWYDSRGRPAWFRLAEGLSAPGDLAPALAARGYAPDTRTLVMARALAGGGEADAALAFDAAPSGAFLSLLRQAAPNDADFAERSDVAARTPAPRAFARLSEAGRPVAVGACVVAEGLGLIFLMRTAASAQRRGLARRVLRSLMAWAAAAGAEAAFLQVEAANQPAVALYASEGFETAYSYVYWRSSR